MTIGYGGCFILGAIAGVVLSFIVLVLFALAAAGGAGKRGDK